MNTLKLEIDALSRIVEEYKEHFQHFQKKGFSNKLKDFLDNDVFKNERYLFIKKTKSTIYAQCSHCNAVITLDRVPKQKSTHKCENCNSSLIVRNTKYASFSEGTVKNFYHFEKSSVNNQCLITYAFWTKRTIVGDLTETSKVVIEDFLEPIALYYFDVQVKSVEIIAFYRWNSNTNESSVCFNYMPKTVTHYFKTSRYYWGYNRNSLSSSIQNTPFQYMPIDAFLNGHGYRDKNQANIISLITLYSKYPQIENFYKQGYGELITRYINGAYNFNSINWREKDICKMLRLPKHDLEDWRSNCEMSFESLRVRQLIYKNNYDYSAEFEPGMKLLKCVSVKDFTLMINADKPSRMLKYLEKQVKKYPETYRSIYVPAGELKDLLHDMKYLGMEINRRTIYWKNLRRHHMNISQKVQLKETADMQKKFDKEFEKLSKYIHENDQYLIRPVISFNEVITEGTELRICVGGGDYIKDHLKGITHLFVIREKNEVERPFFTVEIDKEMKSIIQCQGKSHRAIIKGSKVDIFFTEFKEKLLNKKNGGKHEQFAS